MLKKNILKSFISFATIVMLLSACNPILNVQSAINRKKSINQYTTLLISDSGFYEDFKAQMMSKNTYILKDFPTKDDEYIRQFFLNLKKEDYSISKKETEITLFDKFEYKIIITTKNNKYIINIYNNGLATLHTWNGPTKLDTFTVSNSKPLYNIYELCSYLNNPN